MKSIGVLSVAQVISASVQVFITIAALDFYGESVFSSVIRFLYIGFFFAAISDLNFSLTLPRYISVRSSRKFILDYLTAQTFLFLFASVVVNIYAICFLDAGIPDLLFVTFLGVMQVIGSAAIYTVLESTLLLAGLLIISRFFQLIFLQFSEKTSGGLMVLFLIGVAPIALGAIALLTRHISKLEPEVNGSQVFRVKQELEVYFSKVLNGVVPNILPAILMPYVSDAYVAQYSILDRARRAGQLVLKNIALVHLNKNLTLQSVEVVRQVGLLFPRIFWSFIVIYVALCFIYWAVQEYAFSYFNIPNVIPYYEVFLLISVPISISLSHYLMTNVLVHSLTARLIFIMGLVNSFQGGLVLIAVFIIGNYSIIFPIAVYEMISLLLAYMFMVKFSDKRGAV